MGGVSPLLSWVPLDWLQGGPGSRLLQYDEVAEGRTSRLQGSTARTSDKSADSKWREGELSGRTDGRTGQCTLPEHLANRLFLLHTRGRGESP